MKQRSDSASHYQCLHSRLRLLPETRRTTEEVGRLYYMGVMSLFDEAEVPIHAARHALALAQHELEDKADEARITWQVEGES